MVENLQIIMINKTTPQPSLFSSLTDQLNPRHPLYLLANKIDWRRFEEAFSPLYCAVNGRPAKPIRLMCGLLILKHVRNLSDESVVEQWSENAYYQYFCGMLEFTPSYPCNASELVHFRKRVGENGMELILSESIRVNQEDDGPDQSAPGGRYYQKCKQCQVSLSGLPEPYIQDILLCPANGDLLRPLLVL